MKTLLSKIREGTLWAFCSVFLTVMLLNATFTFAYRVENRPVTVTQPDGTELNILASGDEYYHWLHDAKNYTIVMDAKGYYVYANLVNGALVPTIFKVGVSDPETTGLKPGLNYSADYLNKLREEKGAYKPRPSFLGGMRDANQNGNPSFGAATMNPLVIFVRFSGETEFTEPKATYNGVFNTDANSLQNYYLWNSYNQLTINSNILGGTATALASYQDSHARSYFQPYSASNTNGYTNANKTARELQLWTDAINAMKSKVPAGLNIDANNDGWVDEIYFVVRGTNTGWGDILWPHAWGLSSTGNTINGVAVNSFMCVFETWHDVGLLSHETGHVLGAPDYYRYSDGTIEPLSTWETMSNQTNPPQSMTAYTKWKYMGFINSIPEITKSGYYTLSPLGTSQNAYKLPSTKAGEYFVVEYRSKTASSYESQIPGSGLLIYRVNSTAGGNGGGPPDELYVYRPGGTTTTTNGSISTANYSSNVGRTKLTDITSPNAFMSDNSLGHLNISEISTSGATISFFYKKPYCLATNIKNVTFASGDPVPSLTEAIQNISNAGSLTVSSGASATFRSEKIRLLPGFRANGGSNFIATTPACGEYASIPALAAVLSRTEVAVSENRTVETSEDPVPDNEFGFEAFPNPAVDQVNVNFTNLPESGSVVEVYNASGQKLQTVAITEMNAQGLVIDLKDQKPGIYYLKALSGEGSATKKIVIK